MHEQSGIFHLFHEAIEKAIQEQQSRISSLMDETLKTARDQMKLYIDEQRQVCTFSVMLLQCFSASAIL